MKVVTLFPLFLASCISAHSIPRALPLGLPFHTGPEPKIYSNDGTEVQLVGTNWAGHQEAMIPEGLQYASVKTIVDKVGQLNLNVVRLTYATEMIDDIVDNGGDLTLEATLVKALGAENGTIILQKVLSFNPSFTANTTRLQVFDAVANELAAQGIYVHLDNHMSRATWCCGTGDLNAWFGDTEFDVAKWIRGWKYIAAHVSWEHYSLAYKQLLTSIRPLKTGHHLHLWVSGTSFVDQIMAVGNLTIGSLGIYT